METYQDKEEVDEPNNPEFLMLVTQKGKPEVSTYELRDGEEILVGADPENSIHVEDPYLSTRHFKIKIAGGKATVIDLGSTNGIYLQIGDEFEFQSEVCLVAGTTQFKISNYDAK